MPVRSLATLICLSLFAAPLSAQSNAELMGVDHYARSHDYDLIHQRIAVSDFDWDSTSFKGVVTTTLVSLRPGLDSIVLDEGKLLENTKVTASDGHALRTARHGDTLVVFPPRPADYGDTVRFTVAYDGKVANGHGLTFITPDGLPHRPRQIWSQGEAMDNHFWFPTYDFPNDKESWEMVATVDKGDVVVSNGHLVSDVAHGKTHTVTWREDRPSATYLISLIVGPYAEIKDQWKGVPVDYFVYRADSAKAWRLFHRTTDMIDTYSRLTGVKYPWAKYAETTVADFFGGMENVSATTLVDWLPDDRAYQDRPWYVWLLIPHELAHQWFGDYVTTEDWANLWLNEGFAEFMPGQYWEQKEGAHAAEDYYADEYRDYLATDRRRPMALASYHSNNIYPKGALVLKMLEDYLGPRRFWASLHEYLTAHEFGNGTSDDLRQAILRATGENLDWFWSEWVYGAGYPKLDVSAAYDSTAHTLSLHVRQTQEDTLHPGPDSVQFHVAKVFRMPVTIRVGTAGGDVVDSAWLDARDQTITVSGVKSPPTMVVFDDGDHVLKGLTFDEPTAWLATQLGRDPNLWDREWVIDQLAKRTTDPDAAAALHDAALHADYPRTRAEAASALGAFSPGKALDAVAQAAKDTSSAVRAAALGALGRLGGERAIRILHDAWQNDGSYQARAAAVSAIARADSDHAQDVIQQALTTPSYREVIQHTALRAVVMLDDTAAIPTVASELTLDQVPAQALAAFAGRGSGAALDSLVAHLNDERAGVRRYVVQAFGMVLSESRFPSWATVRARLESAASAIRYADTKSAVEKELESAKKDGGGQGG
jgi:aminopeptidase N